MNMINENSMTVAMLIVGSCVVSGRLLGAVRSGHRGVRSMRQPAGVIAMRFLKCIQSQALLVIVGTLPVVGPIARGAHGAFEYFQFDEGRSDWFDAVEHEVETLTFQEFDHLTFINDQFSQSHGLNFAGDNTVAYTDEAFVDGKAIASNFGVDLRFDELQYGIGAEYAGFLTYKFFHGDTLVGPDLGVILGGPGFMGIGFHGVLSDEPFDRVLITSTSGLFWIDDIHLTSIPSPGAMFMLLAPCLMGGRRRQSRSESNEGCLRGLRVGVVLAVEAAVPRSEACS